jgi:hypothetical protein
LTIEYETWFGATLSGATWMRFGVASRKIGVASMRFGVTGRSFDALEQSAQALNSDAPERNWCVRAPVPLLGQGQELCRFSSSALKPLTSTPTT